MGAADDRLFCAHLAANGSPSGFVSGGRGHGVERRRSGLCGFPRRMKLKHPRALSACVCVEGNGDYRLVCSGLKATPDCVVRHPRGVIMLSDSGLMFQLDAPMCVCVCVCMCVRTCARVCVCEQREDDSYVNTSFTNYSHSCGKRFVW